MRGQDTLFSHKSDEWETPQDFFDKVNKEFDLEIDVASTPENRKCPGYFTIEDNGLSQDWGEARIWCNPPYSNIKDWAKKCSEHKGLAVMLVPARTDTKWFHDYCYNKPNAEIRFIKGRLKFGGQGSAPFPSMLVVFRNKQNKKPKDNL